MLQALNVARGRTKFRAIRSPSLRLKIPKTGYVGVGRVTEARQSAEDFTVNTPTGRKPVLDVSIHAAKFAQSKDDPEKAEYFVGVDWLDTVSEQEAINEVGLFGNQNTVCQPTAPRWRQTVERLKSTFVRWNDKSSS